MSDQLPVQPEEQLAGAASTAGALLRKAREAAGLHVAALAVSMKVPVKKLEALEADRLDLLPDAVFVRALASSVCRTLKIDPNPVLDLLPQTTTPRLGVQEHGINTPFRSSGEVHSYSLPEFLRKPVVLLVGALLVGALVLVFFPESSVTQSVGNAPVEPVLPPLEQPMPQQPVLAQAENPVPVPLTAPVDAAGPNSVNTPPVVTAPPAVLQVAPVAAATSGLLVLRSRGEAWVEVVDAKGAVQVRKTLALGESAAVSGALPLSVVIGRADVTDVEVRGKPFGLEKISKENVARFEVK